MSSSEMTRGSRRDGVADLQRRQRVAERVLRRHGALRAARPPAGDRGEHVGGGLDRRALHVVQHAAYAAELLAAAGATGAAVDQHRQGGAVAGGLGRVVAVEHEDAAVPRREAEHERAGDGRVVGDDRADERALAAGGQGDGLVEGVVRHHRGHRAEGLDVVRLDRSGAGPEQHRRHEGAALGVAGEARGRGRVAVDDVAEERSASTALRTSSRWPREASGPIRTDSSPGSPTVIVESLAVIASVISSATAAGTITRRIAVHFWPALAVISVTTPLTKRSHSGSPDVTSGPSTEQLSESASTWSVTPPCSTDGCWRRMPAVWAEPVKATESCTPRWSSRSPAEPESSCSEPSGRMPDSMIRRTTSSVR